MRKFVETVTCCKVCTARPPLLSLELSDLPSSLCTDYRSLPGFSFSFFLFCFTAKDKISSDLKKKKKKKKRRGKMLPGYF